MSTNVKESLKEKVTSLIIAAEKSLGSFRAVATKCGVSPSAISQLVNGTYSVEGEEIYRRIIATLEIYNDGWVIAHTTNLKKMYVVMNDARKERLFLGVSEKAGAGKTTSIKQYVSEDKSNASYFIKCRSWGNKVFLTNLLRTLGINPDSRYSTNDDMLEQVIEFFKMKVEVFPILFIDQINSLRGSAVTNIIIHLYNELEGQMAVMAFGTENFEKEMKRGVKHNKQGFDETDSRFGRRYITLPGSTLADVTKICEANGIADKVLAEEIFKECNPIKKNTGGRIVTVVEDHRRVKRVIQRELIKIKNN
jgi:hypothetical protein